MPCPHRLDQCRPHRRTRTLNRGRRARARATRVVCTRPHSTLFLVTTATTTTTTTTTFSTSSTASTAATTFTPFTVVTAVVLLPPRSSPRPSPPLAAARAAKPPLATRLMRLAATAAPLGYVTCGVAGMEDGEIESLEKDA